MLKDKKLNDDILEKVSGGFPGCNGVYYASSYKINDNCNGCGICVGTCPVGAIDYDDGSGKYCINENCMGCGKCFEHCIPNAIEPID